MAIKPEYKYKAKLKRIIDGDTIVFDIDLGLNITVVNQHIRLYGLNTPEIRGEERVEGLKAKKFVEKSLRKGKNIEIVIETIKDKKGKYGRWIGIIWYKYNKNLFNLNKDIIANNFDKNNGKLYRRNN